MADLLDTLQKIQSDPALAKQFMKDPQGTLAAQGLDTSSLTIKKTTDLRRVRPGPAIDPKVTKRIQAGDLDVIPDADLALATVCGGVGYIVCGSVGD